LFAIGEKVRRLDIKTLRIFWIVALGLAAWIVAQLPLDAALQSISGLSVLQWLLWIALNLLIIALLVGRWQVLTGAIGSRIGFQQLLRIRQAGQLISFVTPGPQFGGEPLQIHWLWKRYELAGTSAFLAVGLDRFYELWINFAILFIAVLALAVSASTNLADWWGIALALSGLVSAFGLVAWILIRHPERVRGGIERLTRPWQKHPRLGQLSAHWSQLHATLLEVVTEKRPSLGLALALSLIGWAGMIAEFGLLLSFVGVEQDLATFLLLFTVVRLAFLLPLPGGIGSVEAGMFWAFSALALPLPAAASLIALMRLRDVLVLLAGALMLPGLSASAKAR